MSWVPTILTLQTIYEQTLALSTNQQSIEWALSMLNRYHAFGRALNNVALIDDPHIAGASALDELLNDPAALAAATNNSIIMSILSRSSVGMTAILRNPTAVTAIVNSQPAMTAMASSSLAMHLIFANPDASAAVINSTMAITTVTQNITAIESLYASAVARPILAGNRAAMDIVAASRTAMDALRSRTAMLHAAMDTTPAREAIEGSATAIASMAAAPGRVTLTAPNTGSSGTLVPGRCWVISVTNGMMSAGGNWAQTTWRGILSGSDVVVPGGSSRQVVTVNRFANTLTWNTGTTMHSNASDRQSATYIPL